jgi:hypothetical protein
LAESDSREDGEAAEIELTYSSTGGISRAKPALGTLKVCIIQVSCSGFGIGPLLASSCRIEPSSATSEAEHGGWLP